MIAMAAIVVGLMMLVFAGDALVRGAAGLARRWGLSAVFVGAVIVGLGTSSPELATSLVAAFNGAPALAVGNAVGSNIANVLLVAGVGALARPLIMTPGAVGRDASIMMGATLLVMFALTRPELGRGAGLGLLALLAIYVIVTLLLDRRGGASAQTHEAEAALANGEIPTLRTAALRTGGGLAGVIIGAQILVYGATDVARAFGVSEAVIGLTIVAVGTSLPELAATIAAARRKESDVAIGNIIGSNIFNLLGVIGAAAAAAPLVTPLEVARVDMWVMGMAAALLLVFMTTVGRISRVAGALMLGSYVVYLASIAMGLGRPV